MYKIPESVLVVIYTADLEVLLIERADHPGFWQSVTGSKDSLEEALSETARREVAEETGVIACAEQIIDWRLSNIYDIYPMWRHRYAPGIIQNVEHVFGLMLPRATPITLAAREHTRYIWLPYREAADRCFSPSNAEAILQLPNYLQSYQ